jgi:hypothetical protein
VHASAARCGGTLLYCSAVPGTEVLSARFWLQALAACAAVTEFVGRMNPGTQFDRFQARRTHHVCTSQRTRRAHN